MKADAEKKRKFHESLLQLLYPPPSPKEDNHESVYATRGSNLDEFPGMDYFFFFFFLNFGKSKFVDAKLIPRVVRFIHCILVDCR